MTNAEVMDRLRHQIAKTMNSGEACQWAEALKDVATATAILGQTAPCQTKPQKAQKAAKGK